MMSSKSKSIMQSVKECYLCRRDAEAIGYEGELTAAGLHQHHIMYGTANRSISDRFGVWCWLCYKHHNEYNGLFAVHSNAKINHDLRAAAEREFIKRHSIDLWMEKFQVNYLDADEIERIKTEREERFKRAKVAMLGDEGQSKQEKGSKTKPPEGFFFLE